MKDKMKDDKMVVIGIGSRAPEEPMGSELEQAEETDMALYEEMAPKGNFTSRGLAPLVKAANKLLPLFDQTGDYPPIGDTTTIPTDFTRILAMFKSAVDDAVAKEVLNPEMAIMLDNVRDDSALMSLAGKLDMLSKDRGFKQFLKEPEETIGSDKAEDAMEGEGMGMSTEEEDNLLMERM